MNARLGKRKRRRLNVLDGNPLCCFCGEKPAATEDHQPARALFDGKVWPVGYVFPACEPCNKASKHYENVMSVLVRLAAAREDDPQRIADFLKYADAMRNNFPNLLRILSTREKRNHFQVEGIRKPDGAAFADLRMIGIGDGLATTAVETVLRKLLRALHYKHTGTILPKNADVALRWLSNAYFHTLDDPEFARLFEKLHRPPIRRGQRDLSDQFSYLYGINPATGISGCVMLFRHSIFAIGAVSLAPGVLSSDGQELFGREGHDDPPTA
jgi:hypothetical protein